MSSDKKIVLITGANTGLGLEAVKALYKSAQAYEIIIGSRRPEAGQSAIETVQREIPSSPSTLTTLPVDISSDTSITQLRATLESTYGRLDVLVNNAGANFDFERRDGKLSLREAWNRTWDTNVAGTVVITDELVPLLLKSSDPRLIFITSGTSTLAETERFDEEIYRRINKSPAPGWPKEKIPNPIMAYRSAKTGLNMAMREFTKLLKNDGVKVWAVSPGFLATGLANIGEEKLLKMGARPAHEGGDFLVEVIEGKRDHEQGKAIRRNAVQQW